MLWGGDRLHGDDGVFWFITCLFATQQIANFPALQIILLAPVLTKGLELIGAASMGIMFIHKPLPAVPVLGHLSAGHPFEAFVVFSIIAYVCTELLSRFRWSRAIFLGSQRDFQALKLDVTKAHLP